MGPALAQPHIPSPTSPAPQRCWAQGRAQNCSPAHLLLLEDDLVEEELQVLVGVVDAQLLKAVEVEVLREKEAAMTETLQPRGDGAKMDPAHLEAVDVQDGDGEGLLPWVHQLVDAVGEPGEEQGVESLGNGIPGKGRDEQSAEAPVRHGMA